MNTVILDKALQKARDAFPNAKPCCAIILGSGLADIKEIFTVNATLNYSDIPGLGPATIEGHPGRLVLAELDGTQFFLFQGRRHWYEGLGWEPVAIPVYISLKLGASTMILTNAAGGIRQSFAPGSLMIIEDHINAMGVNPLIGNTNPVWGPRFPNQSHVYDASLIQMLDHAGDTSGISLKHGTYIAVSGPTYETPAEIKAFRSMGADAVGMSTVPEAILANAAGMKVAGISCITNGTDEDSHSTLSHNDVVSAAKKIQPAIKALLAAFLREMTANTRGK